ncbi:hypothetical protein B7G68_18755 [Caulobacter segnis]|nr:hypothetical protein [Caulobacter segnis]AVQ03698.1 hypothetical protein B7G68_18755 [Caulobacter segnis]
MFSLAAPLIIVPRPIEDRTMKTLLIAGALLLALASTAASHSPSLSDPHAAWAKPIVTIR